MTVNDTPDPGMDDGLLVRYLDGELDATERQRLDAAIAHDVALAQRLVTLRHRSGTLRSLLQQTDVPFDAPGVRSIETARSVSNTPRRWLRAAAILLLLGGAVAAVPPLRAWVVTQVQRVTGALPDMEPPPTASEPLDRFATSFTTSASTIDIEITSAQAGGRLIVRIEDVESASAEVRRPRDEGEGVTWLPTGTLRITSAPASTAEYDIVVPRAVDSVRVRLPGAQPVVYATSDVANRRRVFELGPR
jgi:hypothetical protein